MTTIKFIIRVVIFIANVIGGLLTIFLTLLILNILGLTDGFIGNAIMVISIYIVIIYGYGRTVYPILLDWYERFE